MQMNSKECIENKESTHLIFGGLGTPEIYRNGKQVWVDPSIGDDAFERPVFLVPRREKRENGAIQDMAKHFEVGFNELRAQPLDVTYIVKGVPRPFRWIFDPSLTQACIRINLCQLILNNCILNSYCIYCHFR